MNISSTSEINKSKFENVVCCLHDTSTFAIEILIGLFFRSGRL